MPRREISIATDVHSLSGAVQIKRAKSQRSKFRGRARPTGRDKTKRLVVLRRGGRGGRGRRTSWLSCRRRRVPFMAGKMPNASLAKGGGEGETTQFRSRSAKPRPDFVVIWQKCLNQWTFARMCAPICARSAIYTYTYPRP